MDPAATGAAARSRALDVDFHLMRARRQRGRSGDALISGEALGTSGVGRGAKVRC
jgi:hypothetical protein